MEQKQHFTFPPYGWLTILLSTFLLLTACVGSGEQMRRDLAALQEKNLADSLLIDSTLALRLVDYFDNHGTQAERLEAHYLLARTWTDLGQGPRALDAFHTAAEQADTTRLDSLSCHWLSRINGLMAELLYNHQLPYNAVESFTRACNYAERSGENRNAAYYYENNAKCYYLLNQTDKATQVLNESYLRLLQLGDTLSANFCLGALSYIAMQSGDYEKANQLLYKYEHCSLINDESLLTNDQWKILYFYKGEYYLGCGRIDSALYYYRKTLSESNSTNNITLACQGLYRTFKILHQDDSVAKYAIRYAQTQDSTFKHVVSAEMLSMHHLYSFSRIQSIADKKTIEADNANLLALHLGIALIVVLASAIIGYVYIRAQNKLRTQRMNTKYVTDIAMYVKAKAELQSLSDAHAEHRRRMEAEINRLKQEIQKFHTVSEQVNIWDDVDQTFDVAVVSSFHMAAAQGKQMCDSAWIELRKTCNILLPKFMDFLLKNGERLDLLDTHICILTKLRFVASEQCVLLNISSSNLSHRRKRLNLKLFEKNGSAIDFDERIHAIR